MASLAKCTSWILWFVLAVALSGCAGSDAEDLSPTQADSVQQQATETTAPPPTETSVPPQPTSTAASLPVVCQNLEDHSEGLGRTGREVVTEMVTRLNAGDVPGAMALFADKARLYRFGEPPTGFTIARRKQGICQALEELVNDNLEWELDILSQVPTTSGQAVTMESGIWRDAYRELEVAPVKFFDRILVEDGRITRFDRWLEQESLANIRAALPEEFTRSSPAPSALPAASGTDATIIFSDYSCSYEGPAVWQVGELNIKLENRDHDELRYGLVTIVVEEGKDFFDLAVASRSWVASWARYSVVAPDSDSWESKTVTLTVIAGPPRYLMCSVPDAVVGLLGPFEAQP